MTLALWDEAVSVAKIKLKRNTKTFTRIDGDLLKEAQTIYSLLIANAK
jgi:hypothetical protein